MRRAVTLSAILATALGTALFVSAGTASADPSANAWYQLRMCESSNNYTINTGNGYYGAYQFDLATWRSVGGTGYPNQASPAEQDYRALILYRERGWQPWTCATLLGLRPDADAASGVLPPRPGNTGTTTSSKPETTGTTKTATMSSAPAWPGRQFFQGDYSSQLVAWQKQMGKLGYGLTGTGYFGSNTLAAVDALQRKAGLDVVGYIGPLTWAAAWNPANAVGNTPSSTGASGTSASLPLQTAASCSVGAKTPPAFSGAYLYPGDTSRALQCFQKELGSKGYGLVGTGYYGDSTKAAVLDLQRRLHLEVDGVIGPITWRAAWTSPHR